MEEMKGVDELLEELLGLLKVADNHATTVNALRIIAQDMAAHPPKNLFEDIRVRLSDALWEFFIGMELLDRRQRPYRLMPVSRQNRLRLEAICWLLQAILLLMEGGNSSILEADADVLLASARTCLLVSGAMLHSDDLLFIAYRRTAELISTDTSIPASC